MLHIHSRNVKEVQVSENKEKLKCFISLSLSGYHYLHKVYENVL